MNELRVTVNPSVFEAIKKRLKTAHLLFDTRLRPGRNLMFVEEPENPTDKPRMIMGEVTYLDYWQDKQGEWLTLANFHVFHEVAYLDSPIIPRGVTIQ